jgi:hypothetical protein
MAAINPYGTYSYFVWGEANHDLRKNNVIKWGSYSLFVWGESMQLVAPEGAFGNFFLVFN